eukprot:8669336-Alexandrium_andersonii.AAC.1
MPSDAMPSWWRRMAVASVDSEREILEQESSALYVRARAPLLPVNVWQSRLLVAVVCYVSPFPFVRMKVGALWSVGG